MLPPESIQIPAEPTTPLQRLSRYKTQIRDCQRRATDTLPAEVELGICLLAVRDEQLFKLDGLNNIYAWSRAHHGIERTRVNTFLKIGASFTPEQVEGRRLTDQIEQADKRDPALLDEMLARLEALKGRVKALRDPPPDLDQREAKVVSKLTSPLREIWAATTETLKDDPALRDQSLRVLSDLADAAILDDRADAADTAVDVLQRLAPRLPEDSPFSLYCRVLLGLDAVLNRRPLPPRCEIAQLLALCEQRPDHLPQEVLGQILHVAGVRSASLCQLEPARALLLRALSIYDASFPRDEALTTNLLGYLAWVLEALQDPRAQGLALRYYRARLEAEEAAGREPSFSRELLVPP